MTNLHDNERTAIACLPASRRQVLAATASASLVGACALRSAGAQATPGASPAASPGATPVASYEPFTSITRAEYLASVREAHDITEPESTGGTLIEVGVNDIATLNPIIRGDVYSSRITGLIYEPLTVTSVLDGSVAPGGIADYWEIAEDGRTYTFHIHPDATWHDGTPVTARDCEYTFEQVMAESSQSPRKGSLDQYVESYRAIDDKTFELVGQAPSAIFLENTSNLFEILPAHIWEGVDPLEIQADGGSTGADPARVVGSGPFRFVEWQLGTLVRVAKNADYWDPEGVPTIDEYLYQIVADPTTAVASLQRADVDWAPVPVGSANDLMQSNPEIQYAVLDTASFGYYRTLIDESAGGIFSDVRVRQALYYSIDRALIADFVYDGFAEGAIGTQGRLSPAYAPDRINNRYDYDPEKAKQLLNEAGWVDSGGDGIRVKDGKRLSFSCEYSEASAIYALQLPYMQDAWREIGVELIANAIPFTVLIENGNRGQFEMQVLGFSWGFDGLQGDMFRCDMFPPAGFNRMRYCNPAYDEIDTRAQRELDFDKRIELIIEATNIVNDDAAIGTTVFSQSITGAAPHVHNFLPSPYSNDWWIPVAWVEPR